MKDVAGYREVGFAVGPDPEMDTREMARWMSEAEEAGFALGFFSETIELNRDSVSALTAIGMNTSRLTLGCTQTTRIRNPLVMAQTLASLDELTGGRMMLAPGACTATHAQRYGLDPADPPTALREWVEAIRLIMTGKEVDYAGKFVHFEGVQLGWQPVRTRVPIFIPGTSRTGLRLAGQIGDGVLLNAICSPEYTQNALRIVREAVEEAGRDWSEFRVAQLVVCSVEDDKAAALDAVRWEVVNKFDPIQLPFLAGPKVRVGEPSINADDIPRFEEAYRNGGKEGLRAAIPDSYLEGMTASGTPEDVRSKVDRYYEAGVETVIVRPAARHQARRLIEAFSAVPA